VERSVQETAAGYVAGAADSGLVAGLFVAFAFQAVVQSPSVLEVHVTDFCMRALISN